MTHLGDLFIDEPTAWGSRGDPWLWRELGDRFAGVELPARRGSLAAAIRRAAADAIGAPLTSPTPTRCSSSGSPTAGCRPGWCRWRGGGTRGCRSCSSGRASQATLSACGSRTRTTGSAVRDLRLRNAAENPIAYGATFETTLGMTEDDWRLRARRGTAADSTSVVAVAEDGRWLGMMACQSAVEGDVLLTGVYVEPDARGPVLGVADELLGEVLRGHRCTATGCACGSMPAAVAPLPDPSTRATGSTRPGPGNRCRTRSPGSNSRWSGGPRDEAASAAAEPDPAVDARIGGTGGWRRLPLVALPARGRARSWVSGREWLVPELSTRSADVRGNQYRGRWTSAVLTGGEGRDDATHDGTPFPGDLQGSRGTTRPGVSTVGDGGMCRVRLYLVAAEAENGTAGWFGSESRPGSELPAPLLRSGVCRADWWVRLVLENSTACTLSMPIILTPCDRGSFGGHGCRRQFLLD